MIANSIVRWAAIAALSFSLAACKSSEERAQEHYESGVALLEGGETEKALVEFRNVFNLDPLHREARTTYARIVRDQGNTREAFGQYLRLIEQYPEDVEGRIALSEMAFLTGNWDEFDRHSEKVQELAGDDPRVKAIATTARFRQAAIAKDRPTMQAAVSDAAALAEDLPDNPLLRRVLIEGYLRDQKFADALAQLDLAIEGEGDKKVFHLQKLAVLTQLADFPAVETQLRTMIDIFPEDEALKRQLIRFYMARQEPEKVEDFLRTIADPTAEDPAYYLMLVQFLRQQSGSDAALAEITRSLESGADPVLMRSLRAGIQFEQGKRDVAIAELEDILATAEPEQDLSRVRVALARMLISMGNEVGARRLVEEVLAEFPNQTEALKMQAAWQIDADQTDQAISTLRTVLDNSPEDVGAMTLMAQAYTRAGNQDLARDFLSLAVEQSGNAPEESIRYARGLIREESYLPAESTLISSLRANPNNVSVLNELGRLYLAMDDISRAQQIVDTLRRVGTEQAQGNARTLEVQLLAKQEGPDSALEYLSELAQEDGNSAAKIAVVRALLSAGKVEDALASAESALAEDPENPSLRFMLYATQAAAGDIPSAIEGYKQLVKEDPARDRVWIALARAYAATEQTELSNKAISDGIAANPASPNLLWAKATILERSGDIDGAIAVYEDMYAENSNSPVIANNLASLLSNHRDDPESLERAYNAAKRLRNTTVPPFQDTFGWILFKRGEFEEALTYLEPAAKALSTDPIVQYHLAKTYQALENTESAKAAFEAVLEATGELDTRPEIEEARQFLRDAE
ncbi:tetratricopeptide repeat protein [Aliiroseovarius sp. PTFE2010]|uniref:tetratricopeptide repeat protein n=1 Tax=Aliiroseovarius sp. PTFE2010 TaxID=3417190 RepID=UPI003CE974C1